MKCSQDKNISKKQERLKKLIFRLSYLYKILNSIHKIEVDESYIITALGLRTLSKYDINGIHALQQLISSGLMPRPFKKHGIRYWNTENLINHLEGILCKATL